MKKYFCLILALVLLTGCTESGDFRVEEENKIAQNYAELREINPEKEDDRVSSAPNQTGEMTTEDVKKVQVKELPKKVNLNVAFASQAPFADWGLPYQEACEEAALITAHKYFVQEKLDKAIMDAEIKKVVAWEEDRFGLYSDTSLAEVVVMAEEYFNLDVEISDNINVDFIKEQLSKGYLVLTPTAGRLLGNPNYSGRGPLYHFLVIRGYDDNEFITNDVGTRKGEEYKYKYQTVINAIYDLPLKDNGSVFRPFDEVMSEEDKEQLIQTGEKRILIIKGLVR